jgi:CRISPR-associated protein Csc2
MSLNLDFFHKEIPPRSMGKYAHIVILRETKGYALFQTDGELNRSRVSAGRKDEEFMTRITMFKRKQTTPERLNGRELLLNYGFLADTNAIFGDEKPKDDGAVTKLAEAFNKKRDTAPYACFYNVHSCKSCPDCITYGFAVGTGGSEKSKVYSDTAFSLTDYRDSHEVFTLNAPYESGTMSDYKGETTPRINQKDHVKPQVFFPSVMSTRDLTSNLFFYVLNNVMRTERYGATTTRGGTVQNHIVAIVLNDGEIFSNLLFTQALHDTIAHTGNDPIKLSDALNATNQVIPNLLRESRTRNEQVLMGDELRSFLNGIRQMSDNEVLAALQQATQDCEAYNSKYIAKK